MPWEAHIHWLTFNLNVLRVNKQKSFCRDAEYKPSSATCSVVPNAFNTLKPLRHVKPSWHPSKNSGTVSITQYLHLLWKVRETLSRWKRGDAIIESRPRAACVLPDVMHWSGIRLKGGVLIFNSHRWPYACRKCSWLHRKICFTHLESSLGRSRSTKRVETSGVALALQLPLGSWWSTVPVPCPPDLFKDLNTNKVG